MTKPLGLYIHVPFCEKKCKYCDFYSSFVTEELLDNYTTALIREIKQWGGKLCRPIDTIYFGGGTPSLLSHRLPNLIKEIKESFFVTDNAEITLELNPSGNTERLLEYAKKAQINRLSIGVQSGNDNELLQLGRKHTADQAKKTLEIARKLGFNNISVDLMLGLPDSDILSLEKSLEFITALKPEHISSYILKLEENTVLFKIKDTLNLPSDDEIADQYLKMCDFLSKSGYEHYEISNFCKKGFESKHNLKYWIGDDYLGLGPSAHSSVNKKRFYYERDLKGYLENPKPVFDGESGTKEEFIMLSLRLKKGINFNQYESRFNKKLPESFFKTAKLLADAEYLICEKDYAYLTDKGMLISNSIISNFLECIN